MIPRIIHYCWLWPQKPEIVKKCINSWKRFCPDYKIKERNEKNCNLKINKRVKGAVKSQKWAFVADYFRLKALYQYGGIYIDADTEIVRNINEVLRNKWFLWFHKHRELWLGFIGFEPKSNILSDLIKYYDSQIYKEVTINKIVTNYFENKWLILDGKEKKF